MRNMFHWKRRPGEIPRARPRWLLPMVPLVLALAVLAAACGGSSGDGDGVATAGGNNASDASDTSDKKDSRQAALDFARCMREHGVDMSDPQEGEDGMVMIGPGPGSGEPTAGERPPPAFDEAHKACQHFLKDIVQDGGAKPSAEEQDKALRFAKCMRDHGVDVPDPDFSGEGGGFSVRIGEGGIDPTSETFKEAQKACGGLFGPGGSEPGVSARGGPRS